MNEPKEPIDFREELRQRLEEVTRLCKGPEWRQWVEHLNWRKSYLQNEINKAVRNGELVKSQIALALMNDVDDQMRLFRKRVGDTESKLREGRNGPST